MLKKIRIFIKSTHYQTSATLFDLLKKKQWASEDQVNDEPETTEFFIEGNMRDDGTRIYITYKEGELSGLEHCTTVISFQKNQPGIVSMTRSGSVRTAMIFEPGKRHVSIYETPYMPFELATQTQTVQNTIIENGKLHICYTVELKGANAEKTDFLLTVLPYFKTPIGKS